MTTRETLSDMHLGESGTSPVTIALLTEADTAEVLAFERTNRDYFAAVIGDRGDAYFAEFETRLGALVADNEAGISLLCLIRDADGQVVGRVNVDRIDEHGSAELGYRIAESEQGHGYATTAVRQVLDQARQRGISAINARTTLDNVASQRVMERNGFQRVDGGHREIEFGGRRRPTAYFRLWLDPAVSRR